MKRNWYLIAGVIAIALLFFLKYDYDQREKEKQRVQQLNQQITRGAVSVSDHFSKELNDGYGESGLNGLKEIDISGDPK